MSAAPPAAAGAGPRIAFYAPMKPPGHPVPSGDRRMARLLLAALREGGFAVDVASQFRSFENAGDPRRQHQLAADGARAARRLLAHYAAVPEDRPDLWFTYHVYHKTPDWLGPSVSEALGIPYVVAEASHAPKQAVGPWQAGYRAAGNAIRQADAVFCLTRHDLPCVEPLRRGRASAIYLPPFLALADPPREGLAKATLAPMLGLDADTNWILCVAMMRPGDKFASYRDMARALDGLPGEDWQALIVGDGPARRDVEADFEALRRQNRVRFVGAWEPDRLAEVYRAADLYLWPGVGEAYGMAYLEAQAAGCPVIAYDHRGVPDVTRAGESAVLVPYQNIDALTAAVRGLLDDAERRRAMSQAASAFVRGDRGLAGAAARLSPVLRALLAERTG